MRFSILGIFIGLICISSAFAGIGEPFQTTINGIEFTQTLYNFTQKQDHFKVSNQERWLQRYVVYSEYFNPLIGTVFVSVGGEGPMKGITTSRGWLLDLAKKFNALIVSVEHRFYGSSQPFGYFSFSLSTKNLSYLTADQALEDLAAIIQAFQTDPVMIKRFGTSQRNPFITVGSSYPGALSAWFRAKYPHLTAGSLASSAVVNSIVNFDEYDFQVYQSTLEYSKQCPTFIQDFNTQVDLLVNNADQTGIIDLKKQFNAENLENNNDFLMYLADKQAKLVKGGKTELLCQIFNSDDYESVLNNFLTYLTNTSGKIPAPVGYTLKELQNTAYNYSNSYRQWTYQYCTYYGWLQTANPQFPMRSTHLNLSYFLNQCADVFGEKYLPNSEKTNSYWGGLSIQATNIVFANGSQDPWKWASLLTSTSTIKSIESKCSTCGHGCELEYPTQTMDPAIIQTQNEISGYFQKWSSDHLAKYKYNIPKLQQSDSQIEL